VKNLRWHLVQDAIVGTLPSYLNTTKLRSTVTGTGTKPGGPCHLHFIQNVAPAPAKLATVRSNIAIVHQSVLRVFGWTKKSCIGPPFEQSDAEKGAASIAADHPVFRKPDVN